MALKKLICSVCLVLALVFCLSAGACGKSSKWKAGYEPGEVTSNGGFVAQVGDYVYFINGEAKSTSNNKFGKPIVGSLCRIKYSDLAKDEVPDAEIVVPKLFASTYYSTGLCIFGDYVYYGTPNTAKDKKGNVLNSYINFQRTKLDGTNTSEVIAQFDNMGIEYKFVQAGSSVYLLIVEEGDSVYDLSVYNMSGKKIFSREKCDTVAISDSLTSEYIYFTDLAVDQDGNDEKWGILYAYKFGDTVEKVVIDSKDGFNGGDDVFGTAGQVFKLIKFAGTRLYLSVTPADTSAGEGTLYYYANTVFHGQQHEELYSFKYMDKDDIDNADNRANYYKLMQLTAVNVSKILTDTSLYVSDREIYFLDSEIGIRVYDPVIDETQSLVSKNIFSDVSSATIYAVVDNYAYFKDSDMYIYRVDLSAGFANAEKEQITAIAIDTDWYAPEVIGDYILFLYGADPFEHYVYREFVDIRAKVIAKNAETLADYEEGTADYEEKVDELVEEYFKGITDKEEDSYRMLFGSKVGKLTSAAKKSVDSYISSNYPDSSSSSN